jgi:hypothetical protein
MPPGSAIAFSPQRFVDTRSGFSTADGQQAGGGTIAADAVFEITVAGRNGVLPTALTAAINLTVTGSTSTGWLTVWPCGDPKPNAASVTFGAGQTVGAMTVTKIGVGGRVCVSPSTATHLIADITTIV